MLVSVRAYEYDYKIKITLFILYFNLDIYLYRYSTGIKFILNTHTVPVCRMSFIVHLLIRVLICKYVYYYS